uniref:Putative RNA-directed DNA polymerase n=1 Tax=Schizaphis graminum TaxID=13262 RepID=A0A2S2N8Q9_SCHGA
MNQTNNQTLSIHIRTLISDKRRVRSRWQNDRYPSDKQKFNHLTNTIKKLISKHKSEFFEKKISIPKHKLFEKIIRLRIRSILQIFNIIPHSQYCFRTGHSTVHQIHRLTDQISSTFEKKQYCPGVFLDVAQAFDRVWHKSLLFKLKMFLPAPYFLIICSYLENHTYTVRYGNSVSSFYPIKAGVPQGSTFS